MSGTSIIAKFSMALTSDWEFFLGKLGKKRIFWIGNGAYIQPLVIGRKGPVCFG